MMGMNNLNPPPLEELQTAAEWRARHLTAITPEAWDAFQQLVELTAKIDTGEAAAHLAAIRKATAEQQQGLAFLDYVAKRTAELDDLQLKVDAEMKLATEEKTKWTELRNVAERRHQEMQSILGA